MKHYGLAIGLMLFTGFLTSCKSADLSQTKDYAPIFKPNFSTVNVAIIGDSQTAGDYGARLAKRVREDSKQRLLFFGGASSARIHHWIDGGFSAIPSSFFRSCESPAQSSCTPTLTPGKRTRSLKSIFTLFPEIDGYIVTLGDNHYYDPGSVRAYTKEMTKLLITSGKRCAFVTPTLALGKFANKDVIVDGIKQGLKDVEAEHGSACTLIDSYSFGGDVVKTINDKRIIEDSVRNDSMKLHPAGEGAHLWADRVFEKLMQDNFLD